MDRRQFIKSVLGAMAASALPIPVDGGPRILIASPTEEAAKVYLQQYMLGFRVSRELIEDDVYSKYLHRQQAEVIRRMVDDLVG